MRAKEFVLFIIGFAALILLIFGCYVLFATTYFSPTTLAQEDQIVVLKNEQALQSLKNRGKEIENDGKRIEQQTKSIEQTTALQDLPGVKRAAETRAVVWAWLPLLALFVVPSSILLGFVIHRKTQLIPIKATADGIETRLPSREIAMVCQETVGVMGKEAMARALSYTESVSHERFQEVVSGVSALKGLLGKGSGKIQEALPPVMQALPAFTGQVFLSQCRQDGDYEDGYVCWGRNQDDGGLVQIPLEDIQTIVKDGLQGQGKTVATLLEIVSAWHRKYVKGEHIRTFLVDKHAGFDQSLSNRIEELLPGGLSLFDEVISGADIASNGVLHDFLQRQIAEGKQRQEQGMADASLDVIVFDEYTETVTDGKDGKEIEEDVKTLYNYRKAKKYLSLVIYEGTKNKNSARGLSVAKMGISKMLFATDGDDAGRFIGWKYAPLAEGLKKGQCLLKLSNVKDVVKIQLAQVSDIDFYAFKKFVTLPDDEQGVTADSDGKDEVLPILPSVVISAFIAGQKAQDDEYSQGEFARQCHVNKGLVSRALRDDPSVSGASVEKMLAYIAAQERKVVPFRKKVVVNS